MLFKSSLAVALGVAMLMSSGSAMAFPDGPITINVPMSAGGSTDITARALEPVMSQVLGQPVVIVNQPGANGAIGAAVVAESAADGQTLLVAPIGTYSINPTLQPNLAYDPVADFDLLTVAVRTPNVLVTRPGFEASSVDELIAMMKENPETISFANSGVGSSDNLTAALFWQATDTTGVHVAYQGGSAAQTDLIGDHVDVSFQNLGPVYNFIQEGQMKALAQTGETRHPLLPEVPTLVELGYDDIVVNSWQAVAAPKGLDADTKTKLTEALQAALADQAVIDRFSEIGFEVVANTPEEFDAFLAEEIARWKTVIDTAGITVQ